VLALGYTEEKALLLQKEIGFSYMDNSSSNHRMVIDKIENSDIVLIHWWNHPLMYDFLVRNSLPESRIIIWSHVAGFHPPHVFTEKILDYPDIFVFTTPISLETKEVKKLPKEKKRKLRIVLATGGVGHVEFITPQKHEDFNVGYIGTVDYAKTHPNFLNICKRIKVPKTKFIVCGGPYEKWLAREARLMGIDDKFNFTGQVADINNYLSIFDVFGYPLSPRHYGACDQALIESMAAGVVPVVLGNRMEKFMVRHNLSGIVAENENEYVDAIHTLYKDPNLRKSLSRKATKYAREIFSVDKAISDWEKIFEEILELQKTPRKWNFSFHNNIISPKDVFLESLGRYGKFFDISCKAESKKERNEALLQIIRLGKSPAWQSKTKGTVHNYSFYFPDDDYLSFWSKIMR
jgi:glycosyltransferase involved in cell wall biosynthesis